MQQAVQRTDQGYRCGETHHNATVSDAVVVQLRDLHERSPEPIGPHRLAEMFAMPLRTVKAIIYYQRRPFVPLAPAELLP